jgi:1,4-dihydroxy-2-naphthoate polyprenyltransferase
VVIEQVTSLAWVASVPVGLLACALLVVNNLRDIPTDAQVGKRTLAVRLGAPTTRRVYAAMVLGAIVIGAGSGVVWRWPAVAIVAALPLAVVPVRQVWGGAGGAALIPVLGRTGRVQLVAGVLYAAGLALGA